MSRAKSWAINLGMVAGLAFTLVAMVVMLNLTIYVEASVPEDDLPDLPTGLRIANVDDGCASGRCYRDFDVEGGPGDTPESILARLPDEECSAHSLVDRRPLCIGYEIVDDRVRGYLSLGKWLA